MPRLTLEALRTMYEPAFGGEEGVEKNRFSWTSGMTASWEEESLSEASKVRSDRRSSSGGSASSAYASLRKCYEELPFRESSPTVDSSERRNLSISSASSEDEHDGRRTRHMMSWCEEENENLERSLENLHRQDKELKKWLRGSRKLLKDLKNPRRKSTWPPSEDMQRAQLAAVLATEALATLETKPKTEKHKTVKKPQFLSATEIIPDSILLSGLSSEEEDLEDVVYRDRKVPLISNMAEERSRTGTDEEEMIW